jgi:purine-nucleoside/S-methyl-5'-thioadenosine phosphorylase / adenosine deaminase
MGPSRCFRFGLASRFLFLHSVNDCKVLVNLNRPIARIQLRMDLRARPFGPGYLWIPQAAPQTLPSPAFTLRGACYSRNVAAEAFKIVSSRGQTWLECGALGEIPWLVHAFGTRMGGALGPKPAGKNSATNAPTRHPGDRQQLRRFFQALDSGRSPLASLRQTHSAIVYRVSPGSNGAPLQYQLAGNTVPGASHLPRTLAGDALIADQSGILLGIRVADCVPILMVDRERHAVAAVHAGWRGALQRIVEKAAGEMGRMFGSRPENLVAAVGPSIRKCCYEVGEEVADAFCGAFPAPETFFHKVAATPEELRMALRYQTLFTLQAPPGHRTENSFSKVHLDLAAVVCHQLERAGVPDSQIYVADYCTACRTDLFYSYRKEGSLAGRMVAVIGMRPAA